MTAPHFDSLEDAGTATTSTTHRLGQSYNNAGDTQLLAQTYNKAGDNQQLAQSYNNGGDTRIVLHSPLKAKYGGPEKKTTSDPSVIHQETKADFPARLVYPPLDPGIPNPTKPEFQYSDEDENDNDGTVLRVDDDQYTFVALLE